MNAVIQFDFFQEKPSEAEMLRADIKAIKESSDKVRRKLFAENSDLKKRVYELEQQYELLVRHICQKK